MPEPQPSNALPSREALKAALAQGAAPANLYCDWNATAPMRREVCEAMRPYLEGEVAGTFGNAASVHRHGQAAQAALERARRTCAEVLGCVPSEIVFTSGGTEANNLALRGLAWGARQLWDAQHLAGVPALAASRIEHAAVSETLRALARQGFEVPEPLPGAKSDGRVDPCALADQCHARTVVVALMLANNETGVVQPVADFARLLDEQFPGRRARGWPWLHVDAVQAPGRLSLRVAEIGCDTLALTAHKFEGPKGAGLLYVRRGIPLEPQLTGGGHEGGFRGGTPPVALAVGLAEALRLADAGRVAASVRLAAVRDQFERAVLACLPEAVVHGTQAERVANTSFISFPGLDGPALVLALDAEGVSCSTGAACSEGVGRPSHVLEAMGLPQALGRAAVRFSFGRMTMETEALEIAARVGRVVERLRA